MYSLLRLYKRLSHSVRSVIRTPVGSSQRLKNSLVSVHHLRHRAGLVGPVSVLRDWVGYHVYLRHGTSVCWQL